VKALLDIPVETNQTLNIIKAQLGLKNKVEVISHVVKIYKQEHMEPEIRPEYAKKILQESKKKGITFDNIDQLKDRYEKI